MKRSYSSMSMSLLPKLPSCDQNHFKSVLEGTYTLKVVSVVDISKPAERPIEDVEEPEEDEAVQEIKLNKSNARMIQLRLQDSENTEIMAVETERIETLTNIKPNHLVTITGPVEVRCRNMMLQSKHVIINL